MPAPQKAGMLPRFDVGIVTILREYELPAIFQAFDIKNISPTTKNEDDYWFSEIQNNVGPIRIVVTRARNPGNEESKRITESLIENYNPKNVLLIGIGAGVIDKVKQGDVVASQAVHFVEKEKVKQYGSEPRWDTCNADGKLLKEFENFLNEDINKDWHPRFHTAEGKLEPSPPCYLHPKVVMGHIASGEKVIADGRLKHFQENIQGYIKAYDMEGWGFSRAAQKNNIQWLIIRGISDFGDAEKDGPEKDRYHPSAANSAATLARTFIEYKYASISRRLKEPSEKKSRQETPWKIFNKSIELKLLSTNNFWTTIADANKKDLNIRIILPSGKFIGSTGQLPLVSDGMFLPDIIACIGCLLKSTDINLDVQTLFDIDVVQLEEEEKGFKIKDEIISNSNLIVVGTGDINLFTRLIYQNELPVDIAPAPNNPAGASIKGKNKFYNDLLNPFLGSLSVIRSPFNDERILIFAYGIQAIGTLGAEKLLHLYISGKAGLLGNNKYDAEISAKVVNFPCIQYPFKLLHMQDTVPSLELLNIDVTKLARGEGVLE